MDTKATKLPLSSPTCSSSTSSDKMNYALQVALQTMKERCIQLQRRVSNMEEENQRLRESSSTNNIGKTDCSDDVISLRLRVDELQRQKEQFEDQINMVSNENRRLWSRLSKISKDHSQDSKDGDMAITTNTPGVATFVGANQNLIRSKTFTQHSPNPQLRQKLITKVSLEEIALEDYITSETELGYPCGLNVDNLNTANDLDGNVDAKQCMEGLQDLRREAMKQQHELNSALTKLGTHIAFQPCSECAHKAANKPEMADKSLETEERSEPKRYENDHAANEIHDTFNGHATTALLPSSRFNVIQEKLKADSIDKTCPMCGKLYSSEISFKSFQEHVEMHFIDESLDVEGSMERQFEFISHAVGDF